MLCERNVLRALMMGTFMVVVCALATAITQAEDAEAKASLEWKEGQQAIHDGIELPSSPKVHLALLAIANGKGKLNTKGRNTRSAKGASKGDHKGKDGYKGSGKGKDKSDEG